MKKYSKYIIPIAIFAVICIFFGDQSLVKSIRRSGHIRELKEQRAFYHQEIDKAARQIESLDDTDSLERFAREHYYMHALGETIYVVE